MSDRFLSYAQNGEDVVLWRTLGHVRNGCYVDVGANDPTHMSVSRAFYDAGWDGLTVEPLSVFAEAHRQQRPRDVVVEAAAGRESGGTVTLHAIDGSGLSTLRDDIAAHHVGRGFEPRDLTVPLTTLDDMLAAAGFDGRDLHFLVMDVEGAERDALAGLDLRRWRPWVLVVEAVLPLTTEPDEQAWEPAVLEAGYRFCQFDGLSRFYVRDDLAPALGAALALPAGAPGVLEDFERASDVHREAVLAVARADAIRWRGLALEGWARATQADVEVQEDLRRRIALLELETQAFRSTVSWRVTKPLRWVRGERGRRS